MDKEEKKIVEMTAEEAERYAAFRAEEEKRAKAEAKKRQREELQRMTDAVMGEAVGLLEECSARLKESKKKVIEDFRAMMELRREVNEEAGKQVQNSFTFTNSEGTQRIRIGYNLNDGYLDQVEEGIAKVKSYLGSLAKDAASAELIEMVMKLLSRDQKGNLKASRVIQLEQLAAKSGSEEFQEGMRIIKEAYRPERTKLYIRCSVKREGEEWSDVGLGIGEV